MLLPLLLIQAAPETSALIDRLRAATRVEIACDRAHDRDEILVCGRREADKRYRVSFVDTDPRDAVPAERSRLLAPKLSTCGRVGAFFSECGFVGVSMSTNGRGPVRVKPRELAP